MKFQWLRHHTFIFIILIGLVVMIDILAYVYYLSPLNNEVDQLELQLEQQEQIIAGTNQEKNDDKMVTSTALQAKLPVTKEIEQVLIMLEEIEQATSSDITSFSIGTKETTNNDTGNNLSTSNYQLSVFSPSYEKMQQFLTSLGGKERIINITSFQFGGGFGTDINYSVSFSTYYSPQLIDLKDEAPTYDYTPPAGKDNPFAQPNK